MITSNSFLGLKDLSTTETGTLATGNTDSISLAPPQGKIYQIIHIGFYCAKVGTGDGGTHSWKLTNDSGVGGRNRLL